MRITVDTTPGRMKIAALLPQHPKISHELLEKTLTKKEIGNLIDIVYRHCGQKATVIFADQHHGARLQGSGARPASRSAWTTWSCRRRRKRSSRKRASASAEYEQQYADGLITKGEKYNKVVDAWSKCTDKVADAMMDETPSRPS